jgi:hypothetical protein
MSTGNKNVLKIHVATKYSGKAGSSNLKHEDVCAVLTNRKFLRPSCAAVCELIEAAIFGGCSLTKLEVMEIA